MKKFILFLALFVGSMGIAEAQRAAGNKAETNFSKKVLKQRKQMYHFDKVKKDPNIKHNGSEYYRGEKYNVCRRSFKSGKPYQARAVHARKIKNRNFDTWMISMNYDKLKGK